jgi:hypothetical protein
MLELTSSCREYVVSSFMYGAWDIEAQGFATYSAARRYVVNSRYWDGIPRRVERVQ